MLILINIAPVPTVHTIVPDGTPPWLKARLVNTVNEVTYKHARQEEQPQGWLDTVMANPNVPNEMNES